MVNINVNAIVPSVEVKIFEYDKNTKFSLGLHPNSSQVKRRDLGPDEKMFVDYFRGKLDEIEKTCALVSKVKDNTFMVVLNKDLIEYVHSSSWMADFVSEDIFRAGFILHELAHIKYSNWEVENQAKLVQKSVLYDYVYSLLEDARIEYLMTLDFPECGIFFNILLAAMRDLPSIGKQHSYSNEADDLEQRISEFNYLARYNIVPEYSKNDFVSNILPLVLLSRRGTSEDCEISSEIIENFFKQEISPLDNNMKVPQSLLGKEKPKPITKRGLNKIKRDIGKDDAGITEISGKFFDKDKLEEQLDYGMKASDKVVMENKKQTGFFLEVAKEHRREIEGLRGIFQKAFTEYKDILVKEGDINFAKQQQAYMNSITGEEGNNYQYKKKEKVLVDVVILRDVSGSTSGSKVDYAKAIVIFLSALENIEGIRTSQIDFNGSHRVNKTFDDGIELATINPVAEGGTSITGAYKEVLGFNFKGKKNIVIVFSDGEVFEAKSVIDDLENRIKRTAKLVKFGIGGFKGSGYKPITIATMQDEMMRVIIQEGLQ